MLRTISELVAHILPSTDATDAAHLTKSHDVSPQYRIRLSWSGISRRGNNANRVALLGDLDSDGAFERSQKAFPEAMKTARTHNYTARHWGHDYLITLIKKGGLELSITGWGRGISDGDYILMESQSTEPGSNRDTRYKVKKIRYYTNPPDMWAMTATFAPRT
jgi:hypothetical protein